MTLIILLIVLVTERVALQGPQWRVERYLIWYVKNCSKSVLRKADDTLGLFIFVGIPALVFGLVMAFFDSDIIDFLLGLVVLAVCVGNSVVRAYYRQYLNAHNRKDEEAQEILKAKLAMADNGETDFLDADVTTEEGSIGGPLKKERVAEESKQVESLNFGQILIWNNFKYYAAPIFYYVIFGVPGVVFFVTLMYLVESLQLNRQIENLSYLKGVQKTLETWLEWTFWLPSRLVAVGFMFVGHFSHGLEAWLKMAADTKVSSQQMICEVAMAAEAGHHEYNAKHMVSLAKRNMGFFLVIVALLTLYGQIV